MIVCEQRENAKIYEQTTPKFVASFFVPVGFSFLASAVIKPTETKKEASPQSLFFWGGLLKISTCIAFFP